MKLVHCADVHLDSPLRGLESYEGAPFDVEDIRNATRRALENLVELCLEERAALLLIAGDLYDGDWNDFSTGLFFIRQISRLREAGVEVYLAWGNHDAEGKISKRLPELSNLHVFKSRKAQSFELPELRIAVHGQSFASSEVSENLALGYPAARKGWLNVGVLHTSLEGYAEHKTYAPCSLSELASKGYDYWALGHVHRREVLSRDPWVVFPGCLQGRHVRETGPKGCMVVEVDDGHIVDVQPREVDVLRWNDLAIDATGTATESDVLARVRTALSDALHGVDGRLLATRLRIVGQTEAHAALHAAGKTFTHGAQAVSIDAGRDRIWLEKVKIATQPAGAKPELGLREDAMAMLQQAVDEGLQNPDGLEVWRGEIAELLAKLPAEAVNDDQFANPSSPEVARDLLMRARDLLLARLGDGEAAR